MTKYFGRAQKREYFLTLHLLRHLRLVAELRLDLLMKRLQLRGF